MLASQVIQAYQDFCPPHLSIEGDVSGLQIGTLNKEVKRIMVALDIRETTVAEAIDKKVDLIIVTHQNGFISGIIEFIAGVGAEPPIIYL